MQQQFVRPGMPVQAMPAGLPQQFGPRPVGSPAGIRPPIVQQQFLNSGAVSGGPLTASGIIHGGPVVTGVVPGGPVFVNGVPGAPTGLAQGGPYTGSPAAQGMAGAASAGKPTVPKVELARARIKREVENPDDRIEAYKAFLQLLKSTKALESLPTDSTGRLRVGAPFCHDFFDAPYLVPFLMEQCVEPGRAKSLFVFGADLYAQDTWWSAWRHWIDAEYPQKATAMFTQGDLSTSLLPSSDLIIGVHPEVTHGGSWATIIRNTINSRSEGGVVAFATFYSHEVDDLVKMCEACGCEPEVHENPFHHGRDENSPGTFLRWLVLIK